MRLHKVKVRDLERNVNLCYYLDTFSYEEYRKDINLRVPPMEMTGILINSTLGEVEYSRWSMETVMDYFSGADI